MWQDELLILLPRLRRYARALTADPRHADQLVLETIATTHDPASAALPRPPLSPWLFGVMHRLHDRRSARDRQNARSLVTDVEAEARKSLPMPDLPDRANADKTLARFSQLPVEQREVLVLAVLERLPYAEIAALLGVQVATVMSRLRCAREAMHSTGAEAVARGSR